MTSSERATGTRAADVARLFGVLCAVSLATRAAFLATGFLNVDEPAHIVGSWELAHGGRLYVDFADNKPPLLYAYYAVAQALFGPGLLAVRLFTAAVWLPLTALLGAAFFDFDRRGRAAAIAFLVASAALLPSDAHAVNGEHVLLLPLAASAVLLREPGSAAISWRTFLAGLLVGVATLAKQPAALCGATYVFCTLFAAPLHGDQSDGATRSRKALALGALAAGFALPIAVACALFAWRGTLDAFVFWVLRYNMAHIDNPVSLGDRALHGLKMGGVLVPSVGPLLFAYLRGRADLGEPHRRRLIAGLVVTTFLPALLGWRLFGHYFIPLLFALALGAGPFFADRLRTLEGKLSALVVLGGCVAFTIAGRVVHDPSRGLTDIADPRYARIGAALHAHACGDRPLFVWGYSPQIYVESGLRPASRFVVPIDTITGHIVGNDAFDRGELDTRGRVVAEHWDWLMDDLERRRPEYIVDTAPADLNRWGRYPLSAFPRLETFIARDYRVDAQIGGAIVYRRTDCNP